MSLTLKAPKLLCLDDPYGSLPQIAPLGIFTKRTLSLSSPFANDCLNIELIGGERQTGYWGEKEDHLFIIHAGEGWTMSADMYLVQSHNKAFVSMDE